LRKNDLETPLSNLERGFSIGGKMSQDLEKEPFGEEHFEEVQSFRCGSLPHQVEVSDWLKRPMGEDGALTAIHDPQKPNRVWLYRLPDNSLVGFGAIGRSEWRWTGKKEPYLPVTMITWFGVHEDYQGQPPLPKENRYSRKIFEDLISEALEDQETHPVLGLVVRAENTRAIHLYREFGFTDHGLQPFTDKQTNVQYQKMALILNRESLLRVRDGAKKK
jgi:ribosomal protein S18 acetylase RimI-like enzyme